MTFAAQEGPGIDFSLSSSGGEGRGEEAVSSRALSSLGQLLDSR